MPDTLTPVTQHLAIWDLHRETGWVALFGDDGAIARSELDDSGDFRAIVSMLSDRRGLCFDPRREVIRHVAGAAPLTRGGAQS